MTDEITSYQPPELPKRPSVFERLLGKDKEQKRLLELTEQVAKKLLQDLLEEGRVSVFHEKDTGKLTLAMCTVYLTSPKIPFLDITLWNEFVPSESLDWHKEFFGVARGKKFIKARESLEAPKGGRSITIIQRWDMADESYEIIYLRDSMKEDINHPVAYPNKEKIQFLEEILQTKVDKNNTLPPFHRPYVQGEIISLSKPDDTRIHHSFWARDIKTLNLKGLLGGSQPKLTG